MVLREDILGTYIQDVRYRSGWRSGGEGDGVGEVARVQVGGELPRCAVQEQLAQWWGEGALGDGATRG